jgi:hypothetical protein
MANIQALEALIKVTQARIQTARAAGNTSAVAQANETLSNLFAQRNTLRAQIGA